MTNPTGTEKLKHTPFYSIHKLLGARLVPFVGWEMPVYYKGIVEEHMCVRNNLGLFDVSHMGEVFITGTSAWNEVERLITNDLRKIGEMRVIYSPMCYEYGGIVDDLLVYQFDKEHFMIIVNASNTDKDFKWIKENLKDVTVENKSDDYAQLALQGPKAETALQKIVDKDLSKIGFFCFDRGRVAGVDAIISRTGYTGEDGFEIYFEPIHSEKVWNAVMDTGKTFGIMPIGLGARDTLRFEAGLMLYGNDMDNNTTPLEVPLKWTVSLDKEFIGRNALRENPPKKKLVGFELLDRGVPRHGMDVLIDGRVAGKVASGTFSPYFKKPLGSAFVPPEHPMDKNIEIMLTENKTCVAKLTSTRFYRRKEK